MADGNAPPQELVLKVLVLGDVATGKTSIIRRTVGNDFSELHQPTIGVDFHFKKLHEDNQDVVLQLWDIAGQDRFGAIYRVYYRDAYGALLVFDVSRPETLNGAAKWKSEIDSKVKLPNGEPLPVMLLANKCDKEVEVNKDEINQFCEKHGFVGWYETSAKTNHNIEESINGLVKSILKHDDAFEAQREAANASSKEGEIDLHETRSSKGGCC
eukprot:gb/GECG01012723.1/.p1 GENE.gb/GECG01012723.1/~~gb/GECG01012723.1/.p1  ORF type:complete len:213 (+),score=35.34 gb/GECG01012723.1/:1-639(+)